MVRRLFSQERNAGVAAFARAFTLWLMLSACFAGAAMAQGQAEDLTGLFKAIAKLYDAGKLAEAKSLAERSVAVAKAQFGEADARYAAALDSVAMVESALNHLPDAEQLYRQALSVTEQALGAEHPVTALRARSLAFIRFRRGAFGDAETLLKRVISIREKSLGAQHIETALSVGELGSLYLTWRRYADAEQNYVQALALLEKTLGPDDRALEPMLINLGALRRDLGRYKDAEQPLERALRIVEKTFGAEHPKTAGALGQLATVYTYQARYQDAEPLFKRALAIAEQTHGHNHPEVASRLGNLAYLYRAQGNLAAAEPMFKEALAIQEQTLGADNPAIATTVNNLALLYKSQRRYADAEPLYKRAIAISEKAGEANNRDLAANLDNLAQLYLSQQRFADAEPLEKRALAIYEKLYGPKHPDTAITLNNLAALYQSLRRFDESETLYKRVIDIQKEILGPEHPSIAIHLDNLAALYSQESRFGEAAPLQQQALAILQKTYGPEHRDTLLALHNLSVLHSRQKEWEQALSFARQASRSLASKQKREASSSPDGGADGPQAAEGLSDVHASIINYAWEAASIDPGKRETLLEEAFLASQRMDQSKAGAALTQMAARFAAGQGPLAALVRQRQDLANEWRSLDRRLTTALTLPAAQRDAAKERAARLKLAEIDSRLAAADDRLSQEFPAYAALASPDPLKVKDVQDLLHPGEALIAYSFAGEDAFAWMISKEGAQWVQLRQTATAVARQVKALRCGLDAGAWIDASHWPERNQAETRAKSGQRARREDCAALLGVIASSTDWPPFSLSQAHEFYDVLFGQFQGGFGQFQGGARSGPLLIVANGPLARLPLQTLVTEAPQPGATGMDVYAGARWLGVEQPISMLPSVSSLDALRRSAKPSAATMPFAGFGNPLLDGRSGDAEEEARAISARAKESCPSSRLSSLTKPVLAALQHWSLGSLFRGGLADVATLRQQLPLPETADELCAVAHSLMAPETDVWLGGRMTEAAIKRLSEEGRLRQYRVLHFATHGLVSGNLKDSRRARTDLHAPLSAHPNR